MKTILKDLILRKVLDHINSGVIMLNTVGNVTMINDAACSILKINLKEGLNKNYKELMSMIKSEELENLVKEIEGQEFKWIDKEIKVATKDSKTILKVFIECLKDSQKYIGLLIVVDDLTDIIKAQRAVARQEVIRKKIHTLENPLITIKSSTEGMIKKWKENAPDYNQAFEQSIKIILTEVEYLRKQMTELGISSG